MNSDIQLGKVDATEQAELAEENKIRGYPTLKFYRDGKPSDYNGMNDSSYFSHCLATSECSFKAVVLVMKSSTGC